MAQGFKTGGRKKGTPNKAGNSELRHLITAFLNENIEQVIEDMNALEPKDRVRFYLDLLQYGLPKLQSTHLDLTDNTPHPPVFIVNSQETMEGIKQLMGA